MNLAKLTTIAEKSHYPFKRYPTVPCETVLFPGCAFPSQLPKTMDKLSRICREAGIGIAYDCCGHPLDGFDLKDGTDRVLAKLRVRLRRLGCKMLVTVCPNCYALLKERLQPEFLVVSIFDLLDALDVQAEGSFEPGVLFTPCPDLRSHEMRDALRKAYDLNAVENLQRAGCCGLHPRIAKQGPKQVVACTNRVFDCANDRRIYTYCASCLGQFARRENTTCRHALSVILGVDEAADCKRAFLNRALRTFKGAVNPCDQTHSSERGENSKADKASETTEHGKFHKSEKLGKPDTFDNREERRTKSEHLLSIVVPVYNEEAALPAFLRMIDSWQYPCEVVFSDGGSTDASLKLLEGHTVVRGAKGRGAQCRLGVGACTGDHVLFLHVDTFLNETALAHIDETLAAGTHWGCLTIDFTSHQPEYRFGIRKSNWRAKRLGVPFGDQAMFMTRNALDRVGGMPDLPIMEDYELSRRLRRTFGWPKQLPDVITASVRRFEAGNRTLIGFQMAGLRLLYRLGTSPEKISKMYGDIRERER